MYTVSPRPPNKIKNANGLKYEPHELLPHPQQPDRQCCRGLGFRGSGFGARGSRLRVGSGGCKSLEFEGFGLGCLGSIGFSMGLGHTSNMPGTCHTRSLYPFLLCGVLSHSLHLGWHSGLYLEVHGTY